MKLPQNSRIKGAAILILLLSFGINSCKKSKSNETGTKNASAKVVVRMLGVEETSESLVPNGTGNGKLAVNSEGIQESIVPFNKDISVVATLVPVGGTATGGKTINSLSTNTTKPALKTASIVQTNLAPNVTYRVIVYDSTGGLVASNNYAYGNEGTVGGFILDAGETYTFIAYSINTTAALSSPGSITGDLLVFQKQVTLTYGDNNLDIVFKHQSTQITTNITLDDGSFPTADKITAISGVFFSPTKASASINVSTGVVSYPTGTVNKTVTFTGVPGRTITTGPILIISPATTATLTIGSITAAGTVKSNLLFTGLSITPGQKYNLNLKFIKNCAVAYNLTSIAREFDMTQSPPSTTNSKTVTYNYVTGQQPYTALTYYVFKLGKSFDMTINGVHLISGTADTTDHDFRFDPGAGANAPNVGFTTGGMYGAGAGANAIPLIENLSSATSIPIFQMDINLQTNTMRLFGVKVNNPVFGSSFGLNLLNGYHYNPITWHQGGTNVVTVTQKVNLTPTTFQAKAGSQALAPCTIP